MDSGFEGLGFRIEGVDGLGMRGSKFRAFGGGLSRRVLAIRACGVWDVVLRVVTDTGF